MKKRIVLLASVSLCLFLLNGCALFPFEEDLPGLEQEEEQELEGDPEAEPDKEEETNPENVEGMPGTEQEDVSDEKEEETPNPEEGPEVTEEPEITEEQAEEEVSGHLRDVLREAKAFAVQYDYDSAIALLMEQEEFEESSALQEAAAEYRRIKESCIDYPLNEITHVFFHTLIVDNARAFDGDNDEGGYNQYMTTIPEFNRIIQSMYDKGYVLVSPHDMAVRTDDGKIKRGSILLPPGKIPFVLSQDDVSYYHYMLDDGFADRLVVDENGEVKAEYIEEDGSVLVGDYDMVPLIDTFVKEHPDFSYKGRKGILALTGYNGVLGYRTDIAYKTWENLYDDQREFLESHPDFDFEKEVQQATEVANALKANGWEFASHTWGHKNVSQSTLEELQADNERWVQNVQPILGATDMIIFAFGAEIGDWNEYSSDNEKYVYYKRSGYYYYMNVDSSQFWVQITSRYFRQGRRNLDGYRMFYNPEMVSDLFDVTEVWDSDRPTPVPPIG